MCVSLSWLENFEGNGNQLLFTIPEGIWIASKKRTSEKSQKTSDERILIRLKGGLSP